MLIENYRNIGICRLVIISFLDNCCVYIDGEYFPKLFTELTINEKYKYIKDGHL